QSRDARFDLALTQPCEGFLVDLAGFIEGGREIGDVPGQQPLEAPKNLMIAHAAFSICAKPSRQADSTRPCWHLTPASIRNPICCSLCRTFMQSSPSRDSIRTATAALALRNGETCASAASGFRPAISPTGCRLLATGHVTGVATARYPRRRSKVYNSMP